MAYPDMPNFFWTMEFLERYAELAIEYQAEGVLPLLREAEASLKRITNQLKELPINRELEKKEPNGLEEIRLLRPYTGKRRFWDRIPDTFHDRLEGALLARMAGCTLGAIVENWPVADMELWAESIGETFPPVNYWGKVLGIPEASRYIRGRLKDFTLPGLDKVPVDDDIAYTLLGLLIAEEHGIDFTTDDVGKSWVMHLPMACTAEGAALANLKEGIPAMNAAEVNNPYCQWIGADIRSDPWAYMTPAWPERAAALAYRDAYLSHRRNGIYGEMFFAAAQSAAFALDNAEDALRAGLTEIPGECALAEAVRWALAEARNLKNYKDARAAVDEKFPGMSNVHTLNNACLTIFGLLIGGNDVTKVLSETIAMGLDNDCTAATAGSIVGAVVGKKGVPEHWYLPFKNKIHSYFNDIEWFAIDDVVNRFEKLAHQTYRR